MRDPEDSNSTPKPVAQSAEERARAAYERSPQERGRLRLEAANRADEALFRHTGNPLYLWAIVARCGEAGGPPLPLPDLARDYLMSCAAGLTRLGKPGVWPLRETLRPHEKAKRNPETRAEIDAAAMRYAALEDAYSLAREARDDAAVQKIVAEMRKLNREIASKTPPAKVPTPKDLEIKAALHLARGPKKSNWFYDYALDHEKRRLAGLDANPPLTPWALEQLGRKAPADGFVSTEVFHALFEGKFGRKPIGGFTTREIEALRAAWRRAWAPGFCPPAKNPRDGGNARTAENKFGKMIAEGKVLNKITQDAIEQGSIFQKTCTKSAPPNSGMR